MKKRRACFLLAVLLCLCVLAGCGGGGESRKLPIDFQMSKMDLTLKNYAIVNQRVSGGYEISAYVLYEFPGNDVITAEEIEWLFNKTGLMAVGYYSYVDENEPENTRIGAQLGREEGDQPTRESYLSAIWMSLDGGTSEDNSAVIIGDIDVDTGRRAVAVGGILQSDDETGSYETTLKAPAKAGGEYMITLDNTNDPSLSEDEMSQIRYTMEIDEEHMVEKNGSGKIVSAGSEVDPVLKALIEQGPEDLEW